MPLALPCDCGRTLRIKEEMAGRKIRCPACKTEQVVALPEDDGLEILPDDEPVEERSSIPPRRSQSRDIDSEPEAPTDRSPIRRSDDKPRRKKRRPSERQERQPLVAFEEGWFGSANAGIIGGVLTMLIAVVWFVVGLAGNIIFFKPPILFVIGLIATFRGMMSSD